MRKDLRCDGKGRSGWSDRKRREPNSCPTGKLIADLAARFRVPAIYPYREFVEVGGLMAYGVDIPDLMRRVANMTGQVLGGAKPSDIPFYRQTKYELVLNQKAARSLGLEFPPSIVDDCRRGDRVRLHFCYSHFSDMPRQPDDVRSRAKKQTRANHADDHDNRFSRSAVSRVQAAQGNQPRQRCLRTAQLHRC